MKRKSSLITKLIILTLIIYAVVTIVALRPKIDSLRSDAASLSEQVDALRAENMGLEYDIATVDTPDGIVRIARERLNLVLDGEMVYIDKSK